ncbi:hypothetical protein SNE40_003868 [Patella caerulea]|uniref:Uncharacterized protein n=1 Tax=Patella caerulea TaxID=87958 RepID=A0AAN8Q0Q9_PATCE
MEVAKEEPIYLRLGSECLLRRCLAGKTNNANESLSNNKVWTKCLKSIFAAEFNQGLQVQEKLLSIMDIPIGNTTIYSRKKLDTNLALKRASNSTKEARL